MGHVSSGLTVRPPPDRDDQAERKRALDHQHVARLFIAGAPESLRLVYDAHSKLVFSLCLKALGNFHDAEDCTQQVFTRAWKSRTTYDPERAMGAWLTGITRRVIADFYSTASKQNKVVEATGTDSPTVHHELSDHVVERVMVHHALAELGPPQDQILAMVYIHDMSQRDVSEKLGLPMGTVKSHIYRGLATLRRHWEVNDG